MGKFQSFGSHKNIIRNKGNNLSSLDNYKGNIIKNVLPQKATSSLSNCNSRKKLYKKKGKKGKAKNKKQEEMDNTLIEFEKINKEKMLSGELADLMEEIETENKDFKKKKKKLRLKM